ncbi:MAG: protein phosphatase 2C domain-containing protein [Pseudomonadota bacterium]|nr:protein phosphatase 2C domain-containing protein [Pseudomonadota bacterium]
MSPGLLELTAASLTEVGRRSNNEDCLRIAPAAGRWLAIVADGAGGHDAGEEASRRAVDVIEYVLARADTFEATTLAGAVTAAHAELQGAQNELRSASRMHTTVVVLWIDTIAGQALWAHVGDSRLYLVRNGIATALTVDDSVVQSMVAIGLLTPQQAAIHPQKNQLISALGVEEAVDPHALAKPVFLQEGDAYLLCTDGWWDVVDPTAMAAALGAAGTPDEWLRTMAQQVVAQASPKQDNYSAIGVWVGDARAHAWPKSHVAEADTIF